MAHLESLAIETLASIFEYLSPQSALNFALTSKYIHSSGKLLAHRYKILHLDKDPAAQLRAWLSNGETLRLMRHLKIRGYYSLDDCYQYDFRDDLISLVQKLANLKRLTWTCTPVISEDLLKTIHTYHTSAELRIHGFLRQDSTGGPDDPDELALAASPALTVLTTASEHDKHHRALWLASVKRIITHAPNLKFASVIQRIPYEDNKPLPQKVLQQFQEYHIHSQRSSSLRRLTLDGFKIGAITLQEWDSLADLSLLKILKLSRGSLLPDFFSYAPKVLTNIESLSLNLTSATSGVSVAAESYLSSCPPLVDLSLWSWRDNVALSTILTRHGPSLERLELHERDIAMPGRDGLRFRERVPTKCEVMAIRGSCLRLMSLTIDRPRHTRELDTELDTDEVLQELVAMRLSKLCIYYDLGDTGDESDSEEEDALSGGHSKGSSNPDSVPPLRSADNHIQPFVIDLWSSMFKACSIASPRTLGVNFGEWKSNARAWGSIGPTMWDAKPHERDDQSDVCVVRRNGTLLAD